jgi:hypothetical protein
MSTVWHNGKTKLMLRIMRFAEASANDWFLKHIDDGSNEASLDVPDEVWAELNRKYPDNVKANEGRTDMDLLFEWAFRSELAKLWQWHSEHAVRLILLKERALAALEKEGV